MIDQACQYGDKVIAWIKLELWFWLGWVQGKRKNYADALPCFQNALKLNPNYVDALNWAGHCLMQQGEFDAAAIFFERALQNMPDDAYAHGQFGRVLLQRNQYQEAVDSLNRAFRIRPALKRRFAFQLAFAAALGALGRIEEALQAYRDAADIYPASREAHAGIGWALFETGKSVEAETPLRTAIQLDAGYESPYRTLAFVLQNTGRMEESIPIAQKLVELTPKDWDAHQNLGWALGEVSKHSEALAVLNKALEIDPQAADTLHSIAWNYLMLGEYQKSIATGRLSLKIAPSADTYIIIAGAYIYQHDFASALPECQEAAKLDPASAPAWQNLGHAYLETAQPDEAVKCFKRVLELGSPIPSTYAYLGFAYLALGNVPAALTQCQTLHSIDFTLEQELLKAVEASDAQASDNRA